MAREYVEFPSDVQRDEFCSAVDKLMGWPADVAGPRGATAHIETWCSVYDSPRGEKIARIDESVIALLGQTATIKNRGGQDKQVTLSLSGATRGVQRDSAETWDVKPPRGGLNAAAARLEKRSQ